MEIIYSLGDEKPRKYSEDVQMKDLKKIEINECHYSFFSEFHVWDHDSNYERFLGIEV